VLVTFSRRKPVIYSQIGCENARRVYEILGVWIDDMNGEQADMLNAWLKP